MLLASLRPAGRAWPGRRPRRRASRRHRNARGGRRWNDGDGALPAGGSFVSGAAPEAFVPAVGAPAAGGAVGTDVATLLLADPSPALRYRVLAELLDVPADDPEAADLARRRRTAPEVRDLLSGRNRDLNELAWRLCRLAWLGIDREEPRAEIAERIFARQGADGAFPVAALRRRSGVALFDDPAAGLAAAARPRRGRVCNGTAGGTRLRMAAGAAPRGRGVAAGCRGRPARLHRRLPKAAGIEGLPRQHGGRDRLPRTPSTAAIVPGDPSCAGPAAAARDAGGMVARERGRAPTGPEPATGFITFYARFDLAFVLYLASRIGASVEDPRLADLVQFIRGLRGPYGLWEHPTQPQLGRWLTFDLLASLRRLATGEWTGSAHRIPFRAYPRRGRA